MIILTGRALTLNEAMAFDKGVADFVDKARGIPILIRRLQNILASKPPVQSVESRLADGDLEMKMKVSRALWKGHDVDLTLSEFRVVHLLVSRRGEHISYRELYDSIRYPGFCAGTGEEGFRTNVLSSVKRIRNKFHQIDPTFDRIENFAGFGYIWRRAVVGS